MNGLRVCGVEPVIADRHVADGIEGGLGELTVDGRVGLETLDQGHELLVGFPEIGVTVSQIPDDQVAVVHSGTLPRLDDVLREPGVKIADPIADRPVNAEEGRPAAFAARLLHPPDTEADVFRGVGAIESARRRCVGGWRCHPPRVPKVFTLGECLFRRTLCRPMGELAF